MFFKRQLSYNKNVGYFKIIAEKQIKRTHWVSLITNRNTSPNFDSFGIKYILQDVLNKKRFSPNDYENNGKKMLFIKNKK